MKNGFALKPLSLALASIALIAASVVVWRRGASPTTADREASGSGVATDVSRTARILVSSVTQCTPAQTFDESWREALKDRDARRRSERLAELARRTPLADVPRLLEWVSTMVDSEIRFELRRVLLGRWARSDGVNAMNYLRSLPAAEQPPALIAFVLGEWAGTNPAVAVEWFGGVAAPGQPPEISATLGGALARQPLDAVLGLMTAIPDETARLAVCEAIVGQWKDRNPEGAARLIVGVSIGQAQVDLLGQVIPQWARNDLQGAVQWMRQLPESPTQSAALMHLSYGWTELDLAGAAKFARDLATGHDQFVTTLTSQWAQRDPSAAADWVRQLPEGAVKDRALTSLATAWAQFDPRASVAFALGLPPGTAQQEAVISIVSAWAAKEPRPAADWVSNFPDGRQREYAIENIFMSWTQSDPVGAVAWLQRLPASADRDAALHAGAGSLMDNHPDLATQLAIGIRNEGLRDRQTERAARAWLAVDPDAARIWIDRSTLPASLKAQLLTPPS